MDSALNVNDGKTSLVPAQTLKEMTLTKEQLLEIAKNNILDQVMSSMVGVATKNGASTFSAQFDGTFNPSVLADIIKEFQAAGYVTTTEDTTLSDKKMTTLSLSWA